MSMTQATITVEGETLGDALAAAGVTLEVPADQIEYIYDRAHFQSGATTVRIIAAVRDPNAAELATSLDRALGELLLTRELEGEPRVRVTAFAVTFEIHHRPGIDTTAQEALLAELADRFADQVGAREVRTALRDLPTGRPPRSDHGDRGERRERRDDDRRGRDRGDRGGRGRDRGERGARGRDRGPRDDRPRGGRDRDRPKPERDPVADEAMRDRAREAVAKIEAGAELAVIEGLNSYERFLVHEVVRDHGGLVSRSNGEGNLKAVEVLRASKDEAPADEA
jgi:hypothetical protein